MSHPYVTVVLAVPDLILAAGVGAALAAATGVLLLSLRVRALYRRVEALERIQSFDDR